MRISNLVSAVCATAFLAGSLAVRAQDTPAQAAARAALLQKMSELNKQQSQPTNPAPATSIVIPPTAAPVQAGQPENATPTVPPPAVTQPAPPVIVVTPSGAGQEKAVQPTNAAPDMVMTPVNPPNSKAEKAAAKARAKQEADQAAADLKAKKEADKKAAAQKAADEAAAKAQAKAKAKADKAAAEANAKADAQQAAADLKAKKEAEAAGKAQAAVRPVVQPAAPPREDSGFFTPVPPPSNPEIQTGTLPAAASTPTPSNQLPSNQQPAATPTPAATPAPTVVAAPPAKPVTPEMAPIVKPVPANAGYVGKSLGFQPMVAPPPPVSAQKQAQLSALLSRYMANQITPEEYHKARAEILAQP